MQWLIQEPSEDALFLAGPTLKYYWSMREQLVLKDGILYYRWEAPLRGTVKSRLKLVVPESLKREILVACHDAKPSGHMGRDKTIERVRFSFIWHGLYHDIDLYIKKLCDMLHTEKGKRSSKSCVEIISCWETPGTCAYRYVGAICEEQVW